MSWRKILVSIAATLLLASFPLQVNAENPLEIKDIHRMMDQILKSHVTQHQISDDLMRRALKLYIDQFDPQRLYLLESEVNAFLTLDDAEIAVILEQYKKDDYIIFAEMNKLFNQAIARARDIREKIEAADTKTLLAELQKVLDEPEAEKIPFAKDFAALRQRNKESFARFIDMERRKYGEDKVASKLETLVAAYERGYRQREDRYLLGSKEDKALYAKQENLFILHILKALAGGLDAHTTVMGDEEAGQMKMHLEKSIEGVGIELRQSENGAVVITKLLPNGPAARNGLIHPKDKIIQIDGKEVDGLSTSEIVERLKGATGTEVSLTVERQVEEDGQQQAKQIVVQLSREELTLKEGRVETSYERFGNGIIGKITLHSFYKGTGVSSEEDVRQAIAKLKKEGNLRGLILDLRDNGGGFLLEAVKVAGLFITNGVVVVSKYSNAEEHFYRDTNSQVSYNGPLILLVSKATASAAEIVSQALQDYGVALIVGDEHTYGKGTIQTQNVTNDSATSFLKVTVGEYYTVSGKTPQKQGVLSDIVVPGIYSQLPIGEVYLENTVDADMIPSSYKDNLSDIESNLKNWYERYYMPTLQEKKDNWKKIIPKLQQNSSYRIAKNKNYQAFLSQLRGESSVVKANAEEDESLDSLKKGFGKADLQLMEAVNILKDMIILDPQQKRSSVEFN